MIPTLRFGAGLAYYTAFAVVPLMFIVVEACDGVSSGRVPRNSCCWSKSSGLLVSRARRPSTQLLDSWQKNGVSGALATMVEVAVRCSSHWQAPLTCCRTH